jgi:hypothetical protein
LRLARGRRTRPGAADVQERLKSDNPQAIKQKGRIFFKNDFVD